MAASSSSSDPSPEGFDPSVDGHEVNQEGQNLTICQICKWPRDCRFSYGTLCCSACKMFFRRALGREKEMTKIKSVKRFGECIRLGMIYTPNLVDVRNENSLDAFITNLKYLEEHRQQQLLTCLYYGNHTIEEITQLEGPIEFFKRPENFPMFLSDWVFLTGITSLNYLKQLTHAHLLNNSDRAHLLRHTFFEFAVFTDAMRVVQQQRNGVVEPEAARAPQDFLNGLRERLAGRIEELNVTKEEFVLLALVLFCNPGLPDISGAGQVILNTYRQIYRLALLQHCIINYKLNGPTRLTDLLSIYHIIAKTRHEILHLFTRKEVYFFRVLEDI